MTHDYVLPDYYPDFLCKCGACRHPCCIGWGISLKMEEYFRLLSLECSPELRRRMDVAFHVADHPTPERYALITPNWRGDCPLHREDGYCALQKECGEEVLSSTCRYYPRGPKSRFGYECACSNSCERVLEMLFASDAPLEFVRRELHFSMEDDDAVYPEPVRENCRIIRAQCLRFLADRSHPLRERIGALHKLLSSLEDWQIMTPDDCRARCGEMPLEACLPCGDAPDAYEAFRIQARLARWFAENHHSVSDYGVESLTAMEIPADGDPNDRSLLRWQEENRRFDAAFPDWEVRLEKMLVNHIFYEDFPFSEPEEALGHAFLALCAVCALVRFLAVGWTAAHASEEALVDVCAATFRVVGHTRFDRNSVILLNAMHWVRPEQALALV